MINEKRLTAEFRELVAIDAPSYGEREMADRLKEKLSALGFAPEDHPVVTRFLEACKKLDLPGTLTKTHGGSDNNHFMRNGITGIVLSCGMNEVHSVSEYTTVTQLKDMAALTAELMRA